MQLIQPYINTRAHLAEMMRRYDRYADGYNAFIENRREMDPENKEDYQTLKTTHRELFQDLVLELGKRMFQNIKNYETVQHEQGVAELSHVFRNPICGNGFFVCSTNRYQISKHNKKEASTIYRNLKRLNEAGILLSTNEAGKSNKFTVFHGKKSNFELFLRADFLVVSDRANPDYNPLPKKPKNEAETADSKPFSLWGKFAECNADNIIQEQLINKINSATLEEVNFAAQGQELTEKSGNGKIGEFQAVSQPGKCTGSESAPNPGTKTGTDGDVIGRGTTEKGEKNWKPTGGPVDLQFMKTDRGIDRIRVSKREPAQWHGFHRLTYAAYFVDYLIERIYNRRGVIIIPEARLKAIEYVERYYFPDPLPNADAVKTTFRPCETLDQYAYRFAQLKWCVDAANRYAGKKGAFFQLINKYIDLETPNGLKTTFLWWANARKNEQDKQKHLKNISDLKKLHEQIRNVMENPTAENRQQAENYVENHLAKYLYVFRRALMTLIDNIKP